MLEMNKKGSKAFQKVPKARITVECHDQGPSLGGQLLYINVSKRCIREDAVKLPPVSPCLSNSSFLDVTSRSI